MRKQSYSQNYLKYLSYYLKTQQSEFIHRSKGLKLRGGQSYHLKITPQVRSTTQSFDEISLEDRECKLPHEVPDESFLNSYSERGCIFECILRSAVRIIGRFSQEDQVAFEAQVKLLKLTPF